ncbi:hypothetical protein H6G20_06080 [Desertifilum sp. FACHB-1129]|uniref:hypothetical protein n=1 Tax=unclassified Desertifilum TaxID=2621682 RepID=UPI0016892FF1|nr:MULTISPECIES: hypothetical protein [unclassified Desertifilum]MBD2311225.1 hypothetical protein [Desertifilum sp. FACHB-1129]MBD2324330.1 hypothetical protein [Desertifilum sp. FACHB-866]MBD2334344.1 hypothetical protein [Desertifilum sp. FACHB-868]MDA0213191.1 hypothetical protein [Cyanobacteria bacterium FC1]
MLEERTYEWDTTPITLQIRLQPTTSDSPRQVLLAVTSYDDFPLAILVEQSELSDLLTLPIIRDLLEQLANELPIRRLRYEELHQKQNKSSKQRSPTPASSPPELSPPLDDTPTQISLF